MIYVFIAIVIIATIAISYSIYDSTFFEKRAKTEASTFSLCHNCSLIRGTGATMLFRRKDYIQSKIISQFSPEKGMADSYKGISNTKEETREQTAILRFAIK